MFSTDIATFFCSECIQGMATWDFIIWTGIAAFGTLFSLRKCHRLFKRSRLIEDMPTSRIRSASQGYSELIGIAELQGNPRLAPLTNTLCLWWRYSIERYQRSGKSSHWITVEKRSSEHPFHLKDSTGLCQIDPVGAEISCRHQRTWHGSTRRPTGNIPGLKNTSEKNMLDITSTPISIGGLAFGRRYRYTEHIILEGDPLYTLGHFESDATGIRTLHPKQLIGNILSEWKQDFPTLLEQFDRDGNGELDLEEWKLVRQAASEEANSRQLSQAGEPVEHLLSKPPHEGLPFIISSTEQTQLSSRFRRHAFFYAIGFLLAGSLSCWLITSRFF